MGMGIGEMSRGGNIGVCARVVVELLSSREFSEAIMNMLGMWNLIRGVMERGVIIGRERGVVGIGSSREVIMYCIKGASLC